MADEADREGVTPAGEAGEERQGSSDDAAPGPRPKRPKRTKKKRRAAGEVEAVAREGRTLPAWWPAFARRYPADPELDRLVEVFERGDYASVREAAARLAAGDAPEEVRLAAADLRRRVDPDPLAVTLLLAAVALLVFLSGWYWSHAHAHP
ncbi:hypothetical protein [Chondromyces apiculatus]|uniref:Uncharacterized protein n=1 Tax=Chondromyces apiculatus DSM 436 TaxID=1192034 RepID=A0A017T4Z3_9BACT|nr:hypothetical protein [Chondromyces apiculatus]EYF04037.1 Hypothetical protein CAP_4911 [Chondromyces apiculatus DSM 436]